MSAINTTVLITVPPCFNAALAGDQLVVETGLRNIDTYTGANTGKQRCEDCLHFITRARQTVRSQPVNIQIHAAYLGATLLRMADAMR